MTQQQAWLSGRGVWKLHPGHALAQEEAQIIDPDQLVLAVARITGITKADDRFILDGELLLGDTRVGQPTRYPHRSRNSVGYF